MTHWPEFQSTAADILDIQHHQADCAIADRLDICTCGAMTRAVFANGAQCSAPATTGAWPINTEEDV